MVFLRSRINVQDFLSILQDTINPMFSELFPERTAVFQHSNVPIHTTEFITEWYEEHSSKVELPNCPPQPPYLNIIENIWCFSLGKQQRNRYDHHHLYKIWRLL